MKNWLTLGAIILVIALLGLFNMNHKNSVSTDVSPTPETTLSGDQPYSGDLKIKYNNSEITFSREPQVFGNEVYVPISELANSLGLYVKLESDRYVVLYQNNIFVKLDLESNLVSVNGKSSEISSGPFYSDQRVFAPLLFIAEAYRYKVDWKKETGDLILADSSSDSQFDFIESDNFYKRVDLADLGIRLSIPVHWDALDETNRYFGYKDDFEYFTMNLSHKKTSASERLISLEENAEKNILKESSAQILKVVHSTDLSLDAYIIYSALVEDKQKYNQVTYIFKENQDAYILHFKFANFTDKKTTDSIVSTVSSSFQISRLTIDQRDEHYVEFRNFYRLGLQPSEPIFANKTTNDFFLFKGRTNLSVEGFNVVVSKNSQSINFYVPVKDKKFEQKIYLPFGLGKHDIYIEEARDGGLFSRDKSTPTLEPIINYDENNVLAFSLLNTSNKSIRYLIPSSRVPSDSEKMSDLGNLLTYKEETSYKKAKVLYQWIEKNIHFDDKDTPEELQSPTEVFDNSKANEEELAYFYATLLRSIGIPCRIVTGDFNSEGHFWNELYINGNWLVADLGEEFQSGDGITTYFNLSRDKQYTDYTNIKVLEY